MLIFLLGGLFEGEVIVIRGLVSVDVNLGGVVVIFVLSLRSFFVYNIVVMGLEFICCLNLKYEKKKVFSKF